VSVAICPVPDGDNGSAVTLVHRDRPRARYAAAAGRLNYVPGRPV